MGKILKDASSLEFQTCKSPLEAELLETQLIQTHRPKWNLAGAFYFFYPMIGMKQESNNLYFCYTTSPDAFPDYSLYGAFRSREITRDAFFSLIKLLKYVGHPVKKKGEKRPSLIPKYSYIYGLRQLPTEWLDQWSLFFKGESHEALENLVLALVENAQARSQPQETQKLINKIHHFWKHESTPLLNARKACSYHPLPISQKDRDLLFINFRSKLKALK